jgi:hypothetical protein
LRWAIAYSVGVSPETLWDVVVVVVVCVYTLVEMPASLSLNLWLSRGAFQEWRYIVKRVEGLMAAELMALSVGWSVGREKMKKKEEVSVCVPLN